METDFGGDFGEDFMGFSWYVPMMHPSKGIFFGDGDVNHQTGIQNEDMMGQNRNIWWACCVDIVRLIDQWRYAE
jgi:hypothetical protein